MNMRAYFVVNIAVALLFGIALTHGFWMFTGYSPVTFGVGAMTALAVTFWVRELALEERRER